MWLVPRAAFPVCGCGTPRTSATGGRQGGLAWERGPRQGTQRPCRAAAGYAVLLRTTLEQTAGQSLDALAHQEIVRRGTVRRVVSFQERGSNWLGFWHYLGVLRQWRGGSGWPGDTSGFAGKGCGRASGGRGTVTRGGGPREHSRSRLTCFSGADCATMVASASRGREAACEFPLGGLPDRAACRTGWRP